jgi:hypothetical protein
MGWGGCKVGSQAAVWPAHGENASLMHFPCTPAPSSSQACQGSTAAWFLHGFECFRMLAYACVCFRSLNGVSGAGIKCFPAAFAVQSMQDQHREHVAAWANCTYDYVREWVRFGNSLERLRQVQRPTRNVSCREAGRVRQSLTPTPPHLTAGLVVSPPIFSSGGREQNPRHAPRFDPWRAFSDVVKNGSCWWSPVRLTHVVCHPARD